MIPRILAAAASAFALAVGVLASPAASAAPDPIHSPWNRLLNESVVVAADGTSSRVRYAALQARHAELQAYLSSLGAVSEAEFRGWTKARQLAFLINAYNAFTVELILTRYPDLASIKDLGNVLRSPWKKKFFRLLGEERSLDDLEHGLIRAPGVYDDPRIHFAVVCASVGCPMLRSEAYSGDRLDAQLDDAASRFLRDRRRNRFDESGTRLEVSRIFDWYGADFARGGKGSGSLQSFLAAHSDALADSSSARAAIRDGRYRIEFLDYDWSLNDAR